MQTRTSSITLVVMAPVLDQFDMAAVMPEVATVLTAMVVFIVSILPILVVAILAVAILVVVAVAVMVATYDDYAIVGRL
ncbi:hypothetical protein, partial [Mesorhizobium sp. M8A.F.Ca.ET.181.01.1.1]|uniref:hypothetical protein n=1 Tax=Mesorhizobium sp. M8A.F.Ca.ET.181.01.1.1 TaxID=2563963 RepID=UPI00167275E9